VQRAAGKGKCACGGEFRHGALLKLGASMAMIALLDNPI
jgi:hypothetical protein